MMTPTSRREENHITSMWSNCVVAPSNLFLRNGYDVVSFLGFTREQSRPRRVARGPHAELPRVWLPRLLMLRVRRGVCLETEGRCGRDCGGKGNTQAATRRSTTAVAAIAASTTAAARGPHVNVHWRAEAARLRTLGISLDGMLEKSDLVMACRMAAASSSDNFLLPDPPLPPEELTLAKQAANTRSKPAAKQRSSRMGGWGGRRERNALVHQVALAEKYDEKIDDARLVREEWVATEKFDGIRAVWVPG